MNGRSDYFAGVCYYDRDFKHGEDAGCWKKLDDGRGMLLLLVFDDFDDE